MSDTREPDREIPLPDATNADLGPSDPNDEIPVPSVMSAAEIDERAMVVEALRGNAPPPPLIAPEQEDRADA